jgi:uncharacterized phage protein (TIGR02220 family)
MQQTSFADGQRMIAGGIVPLQRGQLFVSTRFLAARWRWDVRTVHRFLALLECQQMIVQNVNTKGNTLTLVNFDSYQTLSNADDNADATQSPTKQINVNKRKNNKGVSAAVFNQIASVLNDATGKHFKATGSALVKGVRARLSEGFTVSDIETVIKSKAAQWGSDDKMSAYLRPETLFGNKFESYLNEAGGPVEVSTGSTWQDQAAAAAMMDVLED